MTVIERQGGEWYLSGGKNTLAPCFAHASRLRMRVPPQGRQWQKRKRGCPLALGLASTKAWGVDLGLPVVLTAAMGNALGKAQGKSNVELAKET